MHSSNNLFLKYLPNILLSYSTSSFSLTHSSGSTIIIMGSSVFGTPVTRAMLREMPEYKGSNSISQKDLAKVALEKVTAEGKAEAARNFVEKLQSRFGADKVSTMCLMYNATGDTMTYVDTYDLHGRLCESAYPVIIANGQWGAFLHGQYYGGEDRESSAVVFYSALNNQGKERYWMMAFDSTTQGAYNKVYTKIWEPLYGSEVKKYNVKDGMWRDGKLVHVAKEEGGFLSGSIGNTAKPVFEAILTLP